MKRSNIFWVGFSDLMTSLFFVMLVLFVVSIGYLQAERNKIVADKEASEKQLQKIKEIQTSVQRLPAEYFTYQQEYKRFKLNRSVKFDILSYNIPEEDHQYLIEVGNAISELVNNLKTQESTKDLEIKYLIVIEGMSSKDNYRDNFELSYKRALALYKFWQSIGIVFDPQICEIQIAGSGTEGVREYSGSQEELNQQFLIHIIPKIGRLEEN